MPDTVAAEALALKVYWLTMPTQVKVAPPGKVTRNTRGFLSALAATSAVCAAWPIGK
ncbi:hypothetical protein D3C76_1485940 [compost metagenome]